MLNTFNTHRWLSLYIELGMHTHYCSIVLNCVEADFIFNTVYMQVTKYGEIHILPGNMF